MSNLSGYDGEAVGWASVSAERRGGASRGTQTLPRGAAAAGTQRPLTRDAACDTRPAPAPAPAPALAPFAGGSPAGLDEFLRRVVPAVMRELEDGGGGTGRAGEEDESSDSEPELACAAKCVQELRVAEGDGGEGAGDAGSEVLALALGAGGALAAAAGAARHEEGCAHRGRMRLLAGRPLRLARELSPRACVTALRYHPADGALLAYGTAAGDVGVCGARGEGGAPGGHAGRRVAALRWAGAWLAARLGGGAAVLASAGADGRVRLWAVEGAALRLLLAVAMPAAADITCLDLAPESAPRAAEGGPRDTFAVGTRAGAVYVCRLEGEGGEDVRALEGGATSVLAVHYTGLRAGHLLAVSIDAVLRVYCDRQPAPLQVFHLDGPVSCVCWVPGGAGLMLAGRAGAGAGGGLALYDTNNGRRVPVEGLEGGGVTAVDVGPDGAAASGGAGGRVRVWALPRARSGAPLAHTS